MKFEKLNNDKIRITLNIKDLQEKDIDFQSFMSNSSDAQKLFLDMLEEAEKEIGFTTKDYRIMIEALATMEGDFILTVTRFLPDDSLVKKRNIKFRRKNTKLDSETAVYAFQSFEDFCSSCHYIQNSSIQNLDKLSKNFALYTYHDQYYLVITNINLQFKDIKSFYYIISEFATFVSHPSLFHKKLSEYGKLIVKKNALKTILKYF